MLYVGFGLFFFLEFFYSLCLYVFIYFIYLLFGLKSLFQNN